MLTNHTVTGCINCHLNPLGKGRKKGQLGQLKVDIMRFLTLAFALICGMMLLQACVVHFVQGRTPDEWKSRVIYQVLIIIM